MNDLPDAITEIEINNGPIAARVSFVTSEHVPTTYTDLYLFVGKADGNTYPLRIRRFMVPREAVTLVRQLRAIASLIETQTPGSIDTEGEVERERTAGEIAHPNFVYRLSDGTPLIGPCDTEGCVAASKPGGARHDGECYIPAREV